MSHPPLYEQLYTYIANAIAQGKLTPGDRVPSENELAEQFKVSRITSKAALEKLYRDGLIERKRGKGSFVSLKLTATPGGVKPVNATPRILGVVMPDFAEVFGLKLLYSIESQAAQRNAYLMFKRTYGSQDEEEKAIRALLQLGVSGLIVFPVHGDYYNQELLRIVLSGFPVVLVDRYLKGIPASTVSTDNARASQQLTAYLLTRGHRHIAFISPPSENTSSIEDRIQGYRDALAAHGVALNPAYLMNRLQSPLPLALNLEHVSSDFKTLHTFINDHPALTAIVASEYNAALLAWQVTQALHRDLEITCFDSPETLFIPSLFTHIQQNEALMGSTAVDMLMTHIEQRCDPMNEVIGFDLVKVGDVPIP
ncbi:MAG: GntR family transcriptional regulator [Armatimonadetes bacterium]|nr:GntR family transcriptional regulator [Anaerolineae bacterium]